MVINDVLWWIPCHASVSHVFSRWSVIDTIKVSILGTWLCVGYYLGLMKSGISWQRRNSTILLQALYEVLQWCQCIVICTSQSSLTLNSKVRARLLARIGSIWWTYCKSILFPLLGVLSIHTVSQKYVSLLFYDNFSKRRPIFIFFTVKFRKVLRRESEL